jgi:hypothetical protein
MAEKLKPSVEIAEAYNSSGYARRVRMEDGRIYLVCEHWCGSNVEGQCFRDFFCLVPADREQELDALFAANDHRGIKRMERKLGPVRLSRANEVFATEIREAL